LMPKRVIVVGGGISGLATVERLARQSSAGDPIRVTLLEASDRVGGVIRTDRTDGFLLEAGPDVILAAKPPGVEMCERLGIADRLQETPPAAKVAAAEEAAVQETTVQNAAPQDADAEDEALLDMIAMEMGAPDPISDDEIAEAIAEQVRAAEPAPIAPVIVAKAPEPIIAPPPPPPVQQVVQAPPPPPAPAPTPAPAVEMSLGLSLIASGMLRKPVTAANDPLAPIRRMSQAEKIAFFS